jgi:hydroxylaminobenzene mutase
MPSSAEGTAKNQRQLALCGAVLLLIALLTGFYIAAAMGHQIDADVHATVAAHLNAFLGAFWIFAVAWTLPMLRYGPVGQRRLGLAVVVANYANWLITCAKAVLRVAGVEPGSNLANNAVFFGLTVFVVLPSLIAAVGWIAGFRHTGATPN